MRLSAFASASAGAFRLRACASEPSGPSTTSIAVDAIRDNTARLAWPATAVPGPYRITYGPSGSLAASLRSTFRPSVQLRNLRPGVAYDVHVAPNVGAASFTTASADAPAGGGAVGTTEAVPELPLTELSRLEVRVGRVVECEKHPEADTLYVEKVDVGEEEPRTIVSGLVKFVSVEELVGRSVVVLCNLKPRAMRGVTSHGMLLCASNEDHTKVDPLAAPEGVPLGELVTFEGHRVAPLDPGNRASKAFDRIASGLTTDAEGVAKFEDVLFQTSAGPCFSPGKLRGPVS